MVRLVLLVVGLEVCLFLSTAYGGHITMEVDVSATVQGRTIIIDLIVKNQGNEIARDVGVEALIGTQRRSCSSAKSLLPKEQLKEQISGPAPSGTLRTIVPLVIRYKDCCEHPFSVLSYADVALSEDDGYAVHGRIDPVTTARHGKIKLSLKGLDGASHALKTRLVVPDELSITPLFRDVLVPASGQVEAQFELENLSALPGSAYTIVGILSEQRSGGLYENILLGRVHIAAPQNLPQLFSNRLFLFVILFLILVYMFLQFWKKKRNGE